MCKGLSYLPSSCLEQYVSSCVRRTMDLISEILNVCVFFVFQGEQDTCKVQPFGWSTAEVQVNQSWKSRFNDLTDDHIHGESNSVFLLRAHDGKPVQDLETLLNNKSKNFYCFIWWHLESREQIFPFPASFREIISLVVKNMFNHQLTKKTEFVLSGGLLAFQDFLRSEYSEENLKFWLACEDYKGAPSKTKASSICSQFINPDAPQEVGAEGQRSTKARPRWCSGTFALR